MRAPRLASRLPSLLALAVVAAVLAAPPAVAQEEEPPPAAEASAPEASPPAGAESSPAGVPLDLEALDDAQRSLVEEGRELAERVRSTAESLRALADRVETAEGEEARVLRHELADLRLEALTDFHALARNAQAQRAAGVPEHGESAFVDDAMGRAAERLVALTEAALDELDGARDAVDAAEDAASRAGAEERLVFARERVQRLLDGLAQHFALGAELDLDLGSWRRGAAAKARRYVRGLASRIEVGRDRVDVLRTQAENAGEGSDAAAELVRQEARIEARVEALREALAPAASLGVDTSDQQTLLIETTGELTTDVFDSDVAASLTERWLADAKAWLFESGPGLLVKVLVVLLILLAARLLSRAVRGVVRKAVGRGEGRSQLLTDTAVGFAGGVVMGLATLVALSQLGVEIGPLLAGLGIAGFVVGFALQDVLGNFAAGVMILFYRPFDVSHVVEVGGAFGKVKRMNLVSTTLLTFDNRTVIVPNKRIWGEVITNFSDEPIRRVDMMFGVSYGEDVPKVEEVIHAVLKADDRVLADPPPLVKVDSLGDSSVNFLVRPWCKTPDYWGLYWDTHRAMFLAFREAGITVPFPQRDVHLFPGDPAMRFSASEPDERGARRASENAAE